MDADFSELDLLAADLGKASTGAGPFIRKAVEVTARNVKEGARKSVRARRHFRQAANAIDYELKGAQLFGATVLDAEIGYNKGTASGRLGNLIEFGAPRSNNSLPPGGELQKALAANRQDFVDGLSKALDDGLKASGL